MRLNLTRPIAFLDIESTGKSTEDDRIIDLAIVKLLPDMTRSEISFRFNPGMPIPEESTRVHGITDADVADYPKFATHAREIMQLLEGCDLAGFNSNRFDLPLLNNEWRRAGIEWDYNNVRMIDAGNIFKIQEQRTLTAALSFYCGKELKDAHSALADTNATVDVFLGQLERYDNLPDTVEALALFSNYGNQMLDLSGKFTYNEEGEIVFNFGQYKGKIAADNVSYLDWMYYKTSFPADTRAVCERVYDIIKERRAEASRRAAAMTTGGNVPDDLPF